MPRKARVLVSNYPHHIVQRGHNRNAVFVADDDYRYYLENLKEWKNKLGIRLYAWCLMTNHIHLVVEPGDEAGSISQLMKRLAGRQTAYVNKLENRSGSLWEGRFKASAIQRDCYLLACCRYVEMNPVRANMVSGPRMYRWSSYLERVGLSGYFMLDHDLNYLGLGQNNKARIAQYKTYLKQGATDMELEFLRSAWQRNQLTGNKCFVDEIEQRTGYRVICRGRGKPSTSKGVVSNIKRGQIYFEGLK